MAKKRSKKRRPTASGPLSEAPASSLSKAPPPVASSDEQEARSTNPKASASPSKQRSFFDMPADDAEPKAEERKTESSPGQEESSADPSDDAKQEPAGLKEQEPRPEPGKDGGADPEPGASQDEVAEAKDEREDEPEDRKGDADAEDEAAEYDRLHDDFFRKGEEVEKQHMALAQGEPSRLEDTGQTHLVAVRRTREAADRRRKMRRVVGYVLAPAVLIAVIAGVKTFKNGGGAAAGSSRPVATVTVKPALSLSSAVPAASVPVAVATEDAAQEAAVEMADAEAEASVEDGDAGLPGSDAAVQEAEAGSVSTPEPVAVVPDGVDARKEALKALEQGKWARAAEMAQAAISAHPDDATLYLYHGTALQEMGRRGDAKAVFQKCVEQAKRGPIHECRMFSK
jgi:tetratricopeptide (TPR) repeat protein